MYVRSVHGKTNGIIIISTYIYIGVFIHVQIVDKEDNSYTYVHRCCVSRNLRT